MLNQDGERGEEQEPDTQVGVTFRLLTGKWHRCSDPRSYLAYSYSYRACFKNYWLKLLELEILCKLNFLKTVFNASLEENINFANK